MLRARARERERERERVVGVVVWRSSHEVSDAGSSERGGRGWGEGADVARAPGHSSVVSRSPSLLLGLDFVVLRHRLGEL